MQDCGGCGPEWKILSVKQASGSNYAVQFDALRVTSFTWSVVKDCQTFKAGTVSPTSAEVILDFSGINTDGVYWLKAETAACRGFCFPFEFRITHNGGVIEEPLSTPELSVTGVDSDTIRLEWTHGGGADDFTVQSSTDGETWTDYATYSGTLRTVDTSPWTPDTLYWFRIRARKGSNYSDWSNEASGVLGQANCIETISNELKSTFDSFAESNISSYSGNFTGTLYRNNAFWVKQIGSFGINTPVNVASLSKQFAAALLLKLVDEGTLSLDTTVGSLIPSMQTAGKGSIKLRHLMSHTSGLKAISDQGYEDQSGITSEQAVDGIAANVPLLHTPGTYYEYGGVHWCVAARMAEVASGKSWVTLCQEKMWTPLGMSNTSYWIAPFQPTQNPMIHAGLITSISDFSKFMQMRLKKGVFGENRILSELACLSMEVNQTGTAVIDGGLPASYGFGLYIDNDNSETYHPSATSCVAWINRDKKYFGLIFTNVTNSSSANIKNDEFKALARVNIPSAPVCGESPEPTNPRARKVLLHNAVEWNFINLSVNDAKVAKAVSGGVTHVTILLNWWDIETAQDVYDFTKLDAAINYFHSKGLKSLLQLPFRFAYAGMLNASDKAYIDISASMLLRSGNRATSSIEGAIGSKTNPFYVERQLKIIARICDHIATTDLKTKCQHALFIDGASNETGFYTGTTDGIDDGDFSPSTNNDFIAFLQKKYVTVSALNSAWSSNYSVFRQIQVGDYKPTKYSSYYIGYNDNQRTRDWWEYMCVSHKLFYRQVLKAAHNPQSIDPTLSSTNTGIEVAAYLTEGLTGQGVFWGSGVINMLSEFDIIFSSRGAMDGSHVDGNHLKSFAHMMSALRGCLPSKAFGQEMDGDVLFANGQRIGPSRLARTTFAQGAEWLIYVFYDEIAEWDEDAYYSINGDTLTFLQDSQLAVSTYVTGQNRTLPTPSSSLNFGLFDVLSTPNNPNNTVSSWVASVSPDGEGLSSTYVDITMTEILLSNY